MTPLPPHQITDDESEGDEDYVPPERREPDSESDDGARKTKKARLSGPVQEQQPPKSAEIIKAERDALWAEFQASTSSSSNVNTRENKPKMVKVRVTHRFAGEEVIELKEVEEGSAEAKTWPVVAADKGENQVQGSVSGTPSSPDAGVLLESPSSTVSDAPVPPDTKTPSGSSLPKKLALGPRRPAKPKSSLAALAASTKPKKISTLEKSRLDWNGHLASSSMEEVDELEKNRKGGGYLEKVDFLQRVDERKEEALSAGKRRR